MVESESFCYLNPDHVTECEVYVGHSVGPLSYELIRILYDPSTDTSLPHNGFPDLYPPQSTTIITPSQLNDPTPPPSPQ